MGSWRRRLRTRWRRAELPCLSLHLLGLAHLGQRAALVALVPQRDRLGTQRLGPGELTLNVRLAC